MSVARHTAYNLVGAILPIGVTLVTVPLYISAIGLERYGVLALVWVLVGYFTFFDLGIGRATARKMATLADAKQEARNRLFWTSATITAVLAVIAVIAFWPIANQFIARMAIPSALRPELNEALPFVVAAVPVGIVQSLLGGALEGRRAFGTVTVIGIMGNLLTAALPLASVWVFGPRLTLLISATLIARAAVLIAQMLACKRVVPLGKSKRVRLVETRELLAFSGWATISGIAGPLLVYFDRFAIGALIGAAAVGFYVIGYNLISQMQIIPYALSRALFPRLAELQEEVSRLRSIDATRVMIALVTPMAVGGVIAMTPFLNVWLGADVAKTTGPVTVILLTGFWANSIAFIAFARLHAMGRPDLAARVHVAELVPYAGFLFGGIAVAGLKGAAVAWSIRSVIDLLLLAKLAGTLNASRADLGVGALLVAAALATALTVRNPFLYWSMAFIIVGLATSWSWSIVPNHVRSSLLALAPIQWMKAWP
jgi:O-antigen/teichoic acid export membrane protein